MNPDDDFTAPSLEARQHPTSVPASRINPVAAALILAERPKLPIHPGKTPAKDPSDPSVTAGVQSLQDEFAATLAPTEVAFYAEQIKPPKRGDSVAPKNFLQAHMTIIDQLLMDPSITTTKLAHVTGYSMNWLHKVMNSDAFQAKLAERQKALVDPLVLNAIKDRISGLASRALEIIEERMDSDKVSLDHALNVFGITSKAMGMGVQKAPPPNTNNFIVQMPAQMPDAQDWATLHGGGRPVMRVEPLDIPLMPTGAPTEGEANEQ